MATQSVRAIWYADCISKKEGLRHLASKLRLQFFREYEVILYWYYPRAHSDSVADRTPSIGQIELFDY